MKSVFVAMIGDCPTAVAESLEAAQAHVLAAQLQYQKPGEWEHRWDEHAYDGFRLMQRTTARKGRFSWTQRSVRSVDFIAEGDAR